MGKLYDIPRIKLNGEPDKRCLKQRTATHMIWTKVSEQMYIDLKKISKHEGLPMCKILKPLFQREVDRRLKNIKNKA